MKWHLVAADGLVLRSADASTIGEARFRLAPIPKGASVLSALAQATALPQHEPLPRKVKRTHFASQHWAVNEIKRRLILAANVEGICDADIGAAFDTTGEAVSYIRRKLRLPTHTERQAMAVRAYWTLGWPDRRIAKRLGVRHETALRIRQRLGLSPHQGRGGFTKARQSTIKGYNYAV